MISPDTVIQVYNILKSFKEAYEEYAAQVEECEIALRMVTQLMEDRKRVSSLNAQSGIGHELQTVFDQLKRSVFEFDVAVNGVDDEEDQQQGIAQQTTKSATQKVMGVSKSIARKAMVAAQAKTKSEEIKTLTARLQNILTMVDLETSTAQAKSLAIMTGQGATDLMGNTIGAAKDFWTTNFLNRLEVPTASFVNAVEMQLGDVLSNHFGSKKDAFLQGLTSLLDMDGDGSVDVREYAKLVDVSRIPSRVQPKTLLDILVAHVSGFDGPANRTLSSTMLGGHSHPLLGISRISDKFFASYDVSGAVKVWSRETVAQSLDLIASLRVSSRTVTAVGMVDLPSPNTVVLGTEDGTLRLFHVYTKTGLQQIGKLTPHEGSIDCIVSVPHTSRVFVASSQSSKIVCHDSASKTVVRELSGHNSTIVSLEILSLKSSHAAALGADPMASNLHFIASGSSDGEVRVWESEKLFCVHRFVVGNGADRLVRLVNIQLTSSSHAQYLLAWHKRLSGTNGGTSSRITCYEFDHVAPDQPTLPTTEIDPHMFEVERRVKETASSGEKVRLVTEAFTRRSWGRSISFPQDIKVTHFDACRDTILVAVTKRGKLNKKSAGAALVWYPLGILNPTDEMLAEMVDGNDDDDDDDDEGDGDAATSTPRVKEQKSDKGMSGAKDADDDDAEEENEEGGDDEADEGGDDEDAVLPYALALNDDGDVVVSVKLAKKLRSVSRLICPTETSAIAMIDHVVCWADDSGTMARMVSLTSRTCRKQHELSLQVRILNKTSAAGAHCSLCRRPLASGQSMSCGPCKFDCCLECWKVGRSYGEIVDVTARCFVAHGMCPHCKAPSSKLSRVKMVNEKQKKKGKGGSDGGEGGDENDDENLCALCGEAVKGTNAFECATCQYLVCMDCRVQSLPEPPDQDAVRKLTAGKRAPVAADAKHSTKATAKNEGKSTSFTEGGNVSIFGGNGIWAAHLQVRGGGADSRASRKHEPPLSMSLCLLSRGSYMSALRGRTVHRWASDGSLLGTDHLLVRDDERMTGWWVFATKRIPHKAAADCPVDVLKDADSEAQAPAITVMVSHTVEVPRCRTYTVVGTDCGHLGVFDLQGNLKHSYQLLSSLSTTCSRCLSNPLTSFPQRLARMCVPCLEALPFRKRTISVQRTKGCYAWIPPTGLLSCVPGFSSWKRVYVHIPEVGQVSYLAISESAEAAQEVMTHKVPLTVKSIATVASLRYLIAKGSPEACVCGISIFTPQSESAASAVEGMPQSKLCGGTVIDRVVIGLEQQMDFDMLKSALGVGAKLLETTPCIRCVNTATSAFARFREKAKSTTDPVANNFADAVELGDGGSALPQRPRIQRVPSSHFFCEACARKELEEQRLHVVAIACNDHSIFAGVVPVNAANDGEAPAAPFIVHLPFACGGGPARSRAESTVHPWNGQPDSIRTLGNLVVWATGARRPSILLAQCSSPVTPLRSSVWCDIDLADDDEDDDNARGVSAIDVVEFHGTLILAVSNGQVTLWRQAKDDAAAAAVTPAPEVRFEAAGSLGWAGGGNWGIMSTVRTLVRDSCIHIFAGTSGGGVVVWSYEWKDEGYYRVAPCAELYGHNGAVTDIRFVEQRLLTAATDNTIHYWPLNSLGLKESRNSAAEAENSVAEPVDPSVWEWDWILTEVPSWEAALTRPLGRSSDDGAVRRVTVSDEDLRYLAHYYELHCSLGVTGSLPAFYSTTLGSCVRVTIAHDTLRWGLQTVGQPSAAAAAADSGDSGKALAAWDAEGAEFAALVDQSPRFFTVSARMECSVGNRCYIPLDSESGEEGWMMSGCDKSISSGEAITIGLEERESCGYMECADRPLTLQLKIVGMRSSKRGQPLLVGIGLLNHCKKELGDSDEGNAQGADAVDAAHPLKREEENQAALLKRIQEHAPGEQSIKDVVYVKLHGAEERIEVQLPPPWYIPSDNWGELIVANVSSFPSSVWLGVDSHPATLHTEMATRPLSSPPPLLRPNKPTLLSDVDADALEEYRSAQFTRFECPICLELPAETQNSSPAEGSSSIQGLAIALQRRCVSHSFAVCLEPHNNSLCSLCYQYYHQLNRRNCYVCGRATCSDCTFAKRSFERVPPVLRQSFGLAESQDWPVCVVCDLDEQAKETIESLFRGRKNA